MLKIVAALAVVVIVSGCATGARTENMSVFADTKTANVQTPLRSNIAVKDVTGGQETNPAWKSNIGSSDFERALEASLASAGLLAPGKQAGKYMLIAQLEKVDQPFIGISMTVTATVGYDLVERSTGKSVYKKSISLPFTAGFTDAFAGYERLRLANEGAGKVNIKQLIDELLALKIDDVKIK